MNEALHGLSLGFSVALTPGVLFYAFAGCLIGTIVGVLPGLGPLAGLSLLLPATFGMEPMSAIVLMAAIYYGAMYGGSTTSILMNIPGETGSVVTCLDGYAMARGGRAGPALTIAAVGSFVAGTLSVAALMFMAPVLARFALRFGPPEYCALMVLGLVALGYMNPRSTVKSLAMGFLGLFLGTIGIDPVTGFIRFSDDVLALTDGIGVVPVAVGLFGVAEILRTSGASTQEQPRKPRLRDLLPSREEWRASWGPILRGSTIGFVMGLIPGPSSVISTFVSYSAEVRLSKHPERFGRGAIEGVAGPEAANNAATTGHLVPLLALGIPFGAIPALLMSAMTVHNVTPGPRLLSENPEMFWGVVASMYIGNIILLVLNLPLVSVFVNLLRIPWRVLYPIILFFCVLGVFGVRGSAMDVMVMSAMGLLGYGLRRFDFDVAPIILGLVLAPLLELSFRQSLIISGGNYAVFFQRPIAASLLVAAGTLLFLALLPLGRRQAGER